MLSVVVRSSWCSRVLGERLNGSKAQRALLLLSSWIDLGVTEKCGSRMYNQQQSCSKRYFASMNLEESKDEYNRGYWGEDEEGNIDEATMDIREEERRRAVREELDSRTGRLWSDPFEITDEDWENAGNHDSIEEWSPQNCSRVSLERVKIHPDGLPTLDKMASIPLPPPQPPHPAHGNPSLYTEHAKQVKLNHLRRLVEPLAQPTVESILNMDSWDDKQDAIDELFESVENQLKQQHFVLGHHPDFGQMVETALEGYLNQVLQDEKISWQSQKNTTMPAHITSEHENEGHDVESTNEFREPTLQQDQGATPVFIDLIKADDKNEHDASLLDDTATPTLVHPLRANDRGKNPGRMVEEWALAAMETSKRIMMRQCIRQVATYLTKAEQGFPPSRILVKGRKGVGKSATLAAIVASARKSGSVVLFMPEGNRLATLFYYVEPNPVRVSEHLYDLPMLAQEICANLLHSHENDLVDMTASVDQMKLFFSDDQVTNIMESTPDDLPSSKQKNVVDLLKLAAEDEELASGCYSTVIHVLMNQTDVPFVVVMDEFNSYFNHGQFFHGDYDKTLRFAIPPQRITLFQPFMDAMGLYKEEIFQRKKDWLAKSTEPILMKRGGIVVGTTESHAVARRFTDALVKTAEATNDEENPIRVVDVPQFSPLEVEHIVANFEVIGIGRLRFDRGETVMNEQEVNFLRMVSGGVGQELLDACII